VYIPGTNFSLFGRYDDLSVGDASKSHYKAFDSGIAYRFLKNKVLFDWQRNLFSGSRTDYFELAVEIGF
jgi:hypothetical protein